MIRTEAYGICLYYKTFFGIKILLCLSSFSDHKWGFLKGKKESNETKIETALREFYEESGILLSKNMLQEYFEQISYDKTIGVFLVDAKKVKNINNYFYQDTLRSKYISSENQKAQFFNINHLPLIKKKQTDLVKNIVKFLSKN